MEMNKRKQSSSAQDDVYTRVIQPSGLANLVGRDSGIGSTFGATSAGPESISSAEQPQELQLAESSSINEGRKETESGSSCSFAISQQTVRHVQPSNTLPPAMVETQLSLPSTEPMSSAAPANFSGKLFQFESAQKLSSTPKQCSLEQSPYEFHKPNKSIDHAAGHSKILSPSNEQNLFSNMSNSEVLYMGGSHLLPCEPSYSSSFGHRVQEFQESKGSSNLNSTESVSENCSYSCNVHINAEPSDDDLDAIVIETWEYKEEFRESQFDIVLIYSENDRDQALAFRDILTRYIVMEDNRHPSICVLDQSTHLTHINSRFTHMEEALKRSTFMFLFVTKDFCDDSWSQLQRDECLMESINNPEKKWCVVPILTKPRKQADYKLPFGIRALKGVEIYQMLRGKDLKSVDVDTLKEGDVDPYFCNNMRKMLSTRLSLKKQRERQQLVEFQKWLKEEKQRRWKTKQEELLQHFLNEKRRAEERAAHQKKWNDLKQQELSTMKDAANEKAAAEAEMIAKNMRMKENVPYHPGNIETKPFTYKPTMNEAPVVHHHHYYAEVKHSSDKHTVYNIHGRVSESTIGDGNTLNKVMELPVRKTEIELEQTNLEMDSPTDSIEYIIEVEENSACQPDNQQEGFENARTPDDDCACQEPVDEMVSVADQRSPATESPSANLMFLNKGEVDACGLGSAESAKSYPEVDNPLSLRCEGNTFDVLRRFSNEFSSDRPVAAVAPTRQASEPVSNAEDETAAKLPFSEEENYGGTVEKPQIQNEESRLKLAVVMSPCDKEENKKQMAVKSQYEDADIREAYSTNTTPRANTETSTQHKIDNANRSCLPEHALETDESFVVVEKTELASLPRSLNAGANNFLKKKVQTDGPGKVKSLATANKLPISHESSSSEPCLSSLVEKGTEAMTMDENFYDMEKADRAVAAGPNASNLGLGSLSSTSAISSPSPTKKCVLS